VVLAGVGGRRRAALISVLALAAAHAPSRPRQERPAAPRASGSTSAALLQPPQTPRAPLLPWTLLRQRIETGLPNGRLGLVQGQHLFGRAGTGVRFIWSGLVRVRIPAQLIRQGDDGWRQDRFPDRWWMETLHRLRVPFKAVVETSGRATDEEHAAHVARLVHLARPDTVILGNEINAGHRRPGVDTGAVIERYLDRYGAMYAAIKGAAPETRVQLYGEAYDGHPSDPDAFLRHLLAALRRRALPAPDVAGIHVYDGASVLPERVAAYRRLFAEHGLYPPLSIEELGLRQGVIDRGEERRLIQAPPQHLPAVPHRLAELRAEGWMSEDEQTELVAQHLATATACAEQAQISCALDFDAEIDRRRGLAGRDSRGRPALQAFRFLQRLLNDPAETHLLPAPANGGVVAVSLVRRDGLRATICWSEPQGDEPLAPAREVAVPPYTFVCDARGELVGAPGPGPTTLVLPAATTPEAGGAVRVLL
jgi:hypothetical protein